MTAAVLFTILKAHASSLALAMGVFVVYAAGACPTIYVGDSGELVAAVDLLGIPHPSGYPLYVLLGKLWTLAVPLGSVAYRMSLFSALCAAATCGVLHATLRRAGLHPAAAVSAPLLLAVAPSFWGEANVQRVYALNALFVASLGALAFAWSRSRSGKTLVLAFFVCGLGAANHTFMAVVAAALGVFTLAVQPGLLRRPRVLVLSGLAFVAGLLPYAYLPLRSRADPPLDWGNPETLAALLRVMLRSDFWGRSWIESPIDLLAVGADYIAGLGVELYGVGALLALLGALVARARAWPLPFLLLVMAGNVATLALHGSRSDIFIWHRYYIPSIIMGALLAGLGMHFVVERLPARMRWLPLGLPLFGLLMHYGTFDRSRYRIAEDFSRQLLNTLPPGAVLAASDDNILFVLIYLHWVEGVRPDVDLVLQGVGSANLPSRHFDPDQNPMFFTHHPNWRVPGLEVVPAGLVFQTLRTGRPLPTVPPMRPRLEGEHDERVPKDYLTSNLIGHFHYMRGVTFELRDWPAAAAEFEAVKQAAAHNDVLFYNLGLIYSRNGLFEEALAAFERSRALNPRHIAGQSRVRAADQVRKIQAELKRLRAVERSLTPDAKGGLELATLLESRGELLAARGHRLRLLVRRRAGGPADAQPTAPR